MPRFRPASQVSQKQWFSWVRGNDVFRHDGTCSWTTELGLQQEQCEPLKWHLLVLLGQCFCWKYILFYLRFCFSVAKVRNSNLLFDSFCFQSNFLSGSFKEVSSIALIPTYTSCVSGLVVTFQIHQYVKPIDQVASESARGAFIIPECCDVPVFPHCPRRTLCLLNTHPFICSALPTQGLAYRKLMIAQLK